MNIFIFLTILVILIPMPFVLFWTMYRAYESNTAKVVAQLPGEVVAKFPDVSIWFKNYDMTKKINKFQTNLTKALYSYNHADLILFREGLIVIGKSRSYGKLRMLSIFPIVWEDPRPRLSMVPNPVRYIGVTLTGRDIDIEFHDPEYSNNIKLAVKNIGPELYEKMTAMSLS